MNALSVRTLGCEQLQSRPLGYDLDNHVVHTQCFWHVRRNIQGLRERFRIILGNVDYQLSNCFVCLDNRERE